MRIERIKERIPIVLKFINFEEFLKDILQNLYSFENINTIVKNFNLNINNIEKYWLNNPDLRLTQVLINLDIIPNFPGSWYYIEETDWLIKNNYCKFEDINFWGKRLDINNKLLSETKWILLKDLSMDHIESILSFVEKNNINIKPEYKKYFKQRLSKNNELSVD